LFEPNEQAVINNPPSGATRTPLRSRGTSSELSLKPSVTTATEAEAMLAS